MAVEYEWNFEADASSEEPSPERGRRRLRWRTPLIIVAAIVLIGALAYLLVWRLRRTSTAEASAQVRAAFELEQRAFEGGDRELYLRLQDDADPEWVEAQRLRLMRGAPLPPPAPGFTATGVLTIETPAVFGDEAQVPFVRVAGPPGGPHAPFRAVSFYRLLPDGRWVHAPPDADYAGRPLAWVGPRTELVGHMVQTDLFEQLAPELEMTADAFCELLDCTPDTRFRLALTQTLQMPVGAPNDLPAPHLVGAPVADEATAIWNWAMQNRLVDLMIARVAGRRSDSISGGLITAALRARVKTYLGLGRAHSVNAVRLAEALDAGRFPTLDDLWNAPMLGQSAALAEDAATVLVQFVEQEYGREGVLALLSAASRAPDAISLFAIAFGSDASVIELHYRDYVAAEIVP